MPSVVVNTAGTGRRRAEHHEARRHRGVDIAGRRQLVGVEAAPEAEVRVGVHAEPVDLGQVLGERGQEAPEPLAQPREALGIEVEPGSSSLRERRARPATARTTTRHVERPRTDGAAEERYGT